MATEQIKSVFVTAMKELSIENKQVLDENGEKLEELKLQSMANEHLWLPNFALKTNEVCQFLFGGHAFDVVFKLNPDNASGFSIEEGDESIKVKYGYPMFKANISEPMVQKLVNYSLLTCIHNHPSGVILKENYGMYQSEPTDEYLRPLDAETGLVMSLWNDRLHKMEKSFERILTKDTQPEFKL